MENIHVDLGAASYDIEIEKGLLDRLGTSVRQLTRAEKIAIITDDTVDPLYGERLENTLAHSGIEARRIAFPAGEGSKNLTVLSDVYAALSAFGITRSDALITLGGGVPGDLGGFAAATYLRGIDFIQIPTTILAQVDSSVGGKVAVDLPSGKNLAGNFYQPKAVFIDPDLLQTLTPRIIHDGMAEVIKYGCIRDEALFNVFEQAADDQALIPQWEHIIKQCCAIKARIVEADEHDTGERMLLNFGHTIGHAIEKYYGYGTYTHGEAVAVGMVMLTSKTESMGLTQNGTTERIRSVLEKFALPVSVNAPAAGLLENIGHDKKKRGKDITFIILEHIGAGILLPVAGEHISEYVPEGVSL